MSNDTFTLLFKQYWKAEAVVNSCVNPLHAAVAIRYIDLWLQRLEYRKREIHIDEYQLLKAWSKRLLERLNQFNRYGEHYE